MTDGATNGRRSRWQFLLLFVLFFGPLAIAWVLYYGGSDWRPEGRSNHGVLIEPPTPLPETALVLSDGNQSKPDLLRHVWTLLYIDGGECAESCQKALYRSRQVKIALGKESDRVQRVYLYGSGNVIRTDEHRDLIAADAGSPGALDLITAFPTGEQPDADNIYLVDPLGNLMMRFPLEDDARGLLLDLKKLLKLSRIG